MLDAIDAHAVDGVFGDEILDPVAEGAADVAVLGLEIRQADLVVALPAGSDRVVVVVVDLAERVIVAAVVKGLEERVVDAVAAAVEAHVVRHHVHHEVHAARV